MISCPPPHFVSYIWAKPEYITDMGEIYSRLQSNPQEEKPRTSDAVVPNVSRKDIILFVPGSPVAIQKISAKETQLQRLRTGIVGKLRDFPDVNRRVTIIDHGTDEMPCEPDDKPIEMLEIGYLDTRPFLTYQKWWEKLLHVGEAVFLFWAPRILHSPRSYPPNQVLYIICSVVAILIWVYSLIPIALACVGSFLELTEWTRHKEFGHTLRGIAERLGSLWPWVTLKAITALFDYIDLCLDLIYGIFCFMKNRHGVRERTCTRVKRQLMESLDNPEVVTVTLLCHSLGVVIGLHSLQILFGKDKDEEKRNYDDDSFYTLAKQKLRLVTMGNSLSFYCRRDQTIKGAQIAVQTWVIDSQDNDRSNWNVGKNGATRWIDICATKDFVAEETEWIQTEDDINAPESPPHGFNQVPLGIDVSILDIVTLRGRDEYFDSVNVADWLTYDLVRKTRKATDPSDGV